MSHLVAFFCPELNEKSFFTVDREKNIFTRKLFIRHKKTIIVPVYAIKVKG